MSKPDVITQYDRLSDGEHQLIQIIGALRIFEDKQSIFILDEPESHFNPEWRSEFVSLISKYVDTRTSEIIISTHSPFVVSACKSDRVLHFMKNEDGEITVNNVEGETYGASFDIILKSVFDLNVLIPQKPLDEIRKLVENEPESIEENELLLYKLSKFGDSFELNFKRNMLRKKFAERILEE